ncbi:hypothetical protein [Leucobacter chromiireducens]|uniref:hypothetical protein n=1 Tax=Leucobacter chromiireducens TaxID=283877 RepID=UPI003F822250
MSTQTKPQIKRRMGATVVAGAAVLGALLIPTTAHAATTAVQTTDAQIQVVDAAGAPVEGATVEITGTWPELMSSPALDQAEAELREAQAALQGWYDSRHRPARTAADAALQRYLAAPTPANLSNWLAQNSAAMAEDKRVETQARSIAEYQQVAAASAQVNELKAAAKAAAHETRTVTTDADGYATTTVAVGGGIQAQPTAHVVGDDETLTLPYAPSSSSTITVE